MGLSSHPEGGYEKAAQARDLTGILDTLKVQRSVSDARHRQHGRLRIGGAVPRAGDEWIVMDAPLPGLGNWDAVLTSQGVAFQLPRTGRRTTGRRPRTHPAGSLLQRAVGRPSRHRRADAQSLRSALCATRRDSQCNGRTVRRFRDRCRGEPGFVRQRRKAAMPILAIGGDHSFGTAMKSELESVATHVEGAVISNSGHWIMEEQQSKPSKSSSPTSQTLRPPVQANATCDCHRRGQRSRRRRLSGPVLQSASRQRKSSRCRR